MPATHSLKHCPLPTWRFHNALLGLILTVSFGCQPSPSESRVENLPASTEESANDSGAPTHETPEGIHGEGSPAPDPALASRFPWETWYAYYIDEERVGFNHLAADLISFEKQPHVRYRMEDKLTIRRGSAKLVQHIHQECVEQWSGHPVRLEATVRVGPDTTRFRGRMSEGSFLMETIRGEDTTARKIPWRADVFGPFAVEQSLRDNPLEVGGRRAIQTLMPVQNMIGRNELKAVTHEMTDLKDGKSRRLLKVENRLRMGKTHMMTSYAWIDERGRTLKLAIPSLGLTGYRTNRAAATAAVDPQRDVLAGTFVPLSRRIERARELKEAIYRITLADDATLQTLDLPELPGQTVEEQPDGSLRLTVRSGVNSLASNAWAQPKAADIAPGPLVDHQAAAVQTLARQAVTEEPEDPRTTALRLTRFVHQHVTQKDFSRGFSRASQVAEEAVGDCTEHAVLLAALLRDQQIPARVAAGLVYLDTAEGPVMGYHMWNLAFVGDGWLALDATLGPDLAPANRISILTSDLASGNEYECLVPVLSVLGQFEIEVVASSGK